MPASATDSIQILLYIWFTISGVVLGLTIALIAGRLLLDWLDYEARECQGHEEAQATQEVPEPLGESCGWVRCGGCYAKILLAQVPLPRYEVPPYSLTRSLGEEEEQQARSTPAPTLTGGVHNNLPVVPLGQPTCSTDPREPASTRRGDERGSFAENGRDSCKNSRERGLWVEQGERTGRGTPLYR